MKILYAVFRPLHSNGWLLGNEIQTHTFPTNTAHVGKVSSKSVCWFVLWSLALQTHTHRQTDGKPDNKGYLAYIANPTDRYTPITNIVVTY